MLKSTIIGYTRIPKLCNDGQGRRNRFGTDIYVKKRFQRLCGNQEWYKTGDTYEQRLHEIECGHNDEKQDWHRQRHDDRYVESVMFIP